MERETCGAHPELIRSIDQRFDRIEAVLDSLPDRISQATRSTLEQRLELHLLRAHPGTAPGQIVVPPRPAPAADDGDTGKVWQKIIATALLIIATAVAAWFGVPASRADAPKIAAPATTQPTP